MVHREKCVMRQKEGGQHLIYPYFCSTSEGNLGQKHLAAKVEWKRHLITEKGEMGELLGKKVTGDLIPEVSILIKSLIKFITNRIRDLASISCSYICVYIFPCLFFSSPVPQGAISKTS